MIVRFKYNVSQTEFEGIVAEYYVSNGTTEVSLSIVSNEIDKLLEEYSDAHNGDFIECNYQDIIETAFKSANINAVPVHADKTIYL